MGRFVGILLIALLVFAFHVLANDDPADLVPYDFNLYVFMKGKVCDGRNRGAVCAPLREVLVSMGDEYLARTVPLDYTNWKGEFSIEDRVPYGYTVNRSTGEIVEGTSEIHPFLSFKKAGFKEVRIDLQAISADTWIESASPIQIVLQLADSVEDGTAAFHPSLPIPTLPPSEE